MAAPKPVVQASSLLSPFHASLNRTGRRGMLVAKRFRCKLEFHKFNWKTVLGFELLTNGAERWPDGLVAFAAGSSPFPILPWCSANELTGLQLTPQSPTGL